MRSPENRAMPEVGQLAMIWVVHSSFHGLRELDMMQPTLPKLNEESFNAA